MGSPPVVRRHAAPPDLVIMVLLQRLSLLMRGLLSWPGAYSALLISLLSQALASLVKAALLLSPWGRKR